MSPDDLLSPRFWTALAPGLSIGAVTSPPTVVPTAGSLDRFAADIARVGWSQWRPESWDADIAGLAGALGALAAAGLPTPFVFVYDQVWLLFAGLAPLLVRLLGPDYRALPDFWAWHVAASDADAGWPAHRDRGRRALLPDGSPAAATLWVALTDAVPENGCIHLVPADRDPTYGTAEEDSHRFPPAAVVAVPATAGTVLGWNQALLHWGGRSSHLAKGPRLSVSMEFQRGDVEPFNRPLLPAGVFPDLGGRLALIAKQLIQYSHMVAPTPLVDGFLARIAGDARR